MRFSTSLFSWSDKIPVTVLGISLVQLSPASPHQKKNYKWPAGTAEATRSQRYTFKSQRNLVSNGDVLGACRTISRRVFVETNEQSTITSGFRGQAALGFKRVTHHRLQRALVTSTELQPNMVTGLCLFNILF